MKQASIRKPSVRDVKTCLRHIEELRRCMRVVAFIALKSLPVIQERALTAGRDKA